LGKLEALGKVQQPHSILDKLEKLHSNLGEIRNISINWKHLVNSNWPNLLWANCS